MTVCFKAEAAPDRVGQTDIGFNAAGSIATGDHVDSSIYLGGSLSYGVNEWLALGIEAGWLSPEIALKPSAGAGRSDVGDANVVPILFDVILRWNQEALVFVPYAVAGFGVGLWSVNESSTFDLASVSVNDETSFVMKFGGGVDFFTEQTRENTWILNFEFSYNIYSENIGSQTAGGASIDSADLDYWLIGGGIKYLFN